MKKTAHFKFETPKIVGILSDKEIPARLQKKFDLLFARRTLPYICLPFKVEARYLKNVIACMRIMDIAGLIVTGTHTKRISYLVPTLSRSAKDSGIVNIISRNKNRFIGHYISDVNKFFDSAIDLLTSPKPQETLKKL